MIAQIIEPMKAIFIKQEVDEIRMIKKMKGKAFIQMENVDFTRLIKSIYSMLPVLMDVILEFFYCILNFLVFHHDGPFDACRPHRNKQPHKAPVAAFPANSLTNTLAGGIGEVPGLDRDKYFGLAPQEAFQDYGVIAPVRPRRTSDPESGPARPSKANTNKVRPAVGILNTSFDPRLKTEPVHGVESAGLGTSTFLEGAPAPKSAIERANTVAAEEEETSGLVRKKSLVQKIKGRRVGDRSPPPPIARPLLSPTTTSNVDSSYNPFFKEGQFIERVESLPNTSTSNRERADSGGSDKAGANSLLDRVKSLKISSARKGRKSDE